MNRIKLNTLDDIAHQITPKCVLKLFFEVVKVVLVFFARSQERDVYLGSLPFIIFGNLWFLILFRQYMRNARIFPSFS